MKLPRKSYDATVPSTAMGDIAFLLLIFFVILARAQDDSHLQWKPAKADEVEQSSAARVSIVIDADSKMHFNGRETKPELLKDLIEGALGDAPAGKRIVHLKIDNSVKARFFEPVIEAVSMAGGDMVHILEPIIEPTTK